MKKLGITVALFTCLLSSTFALSDELPPSLNKASAEVKELVALFKKESANPAHTKEIKSKTFALKAKSVPVLIEVMKRSDFPDRNRWLATFLLGRIMGSKAAPFIVRFTEHPHWLMRMAALKTLLALNLKEYSSVYAKALSDQSLLVRRQALENINTLHLEQSGPHVWAMLFDKSNYSISRDGKLKRTPIIKTAIRTLGDLKFQKVQKNLAQMIQKKKYEDIHTDLDYSLSKITGRPSPQKMSEKIAFWKKQTY